MESLAGMTVCAQSCMHIAHGQALALNVTVFGDKEGE